MVLGFGSVMRRPGPVFTDIKGKGRQPMVLFDFSEYPILRRALGYFGLLSSMANEKNITQTVYGGSEDKGIHPRPVIRYGKIEATAGAAPAPPTLPKKEGSPFPGYVLDKDHAFSY